VVLVLPGPRQLIREGAKVVVASPHEATAFAEGERLAQTPRRAHPAHREPVFRPWA
jgi:hypothetical protein